MAHTKSWDEAAPAAGDALSSGDDEIRDLKVAIRERMNAGGIKWAAGTDEDFGKLMCGVQGTTGVLSLLESEAGAVVCTVNDGTDVGGNKEFEVGDAFGGSEQYDLRSHTITGRDITLDAASGTPGAATLDTSAGSLVTETGAFSAIICNRFGDEGTVTSSGSYQTVIQEDIATRGAHWGGGGGGVVVLAYLQVYITGLAASDIVSLDVRLGATGGPYYEYTNKYLLAPDASVAGTMSIMTTIPVMATDVPANDVTETFLVQVKNGSTATKNCTIYSGESQLMLINLRDTTAVA